MKENKVQLNLNSFNKEKKEEIGLELDIFYKLDVLEGLKKIKEGSIDLIITSPPFNLGNNHHTGIKRHKSYEDNMSEEEYQEWQIKVLNECFRVLKKSGSMIYHHKNRIKDGVQITPYEWILKTKFLIKQEIVWINRSQNFDKIRFYPFTERIYWLVKDKKTKLINVLNKYDVFDWKEWRPVGINKTHTRAFPEEFVRDMLKVFPNAKIILDPFMGSGTVGVVAKNEGKHFIGFEINETFIELSKKRIGQ
jgi:site-specific DNA-methyltransferase (adenine-specific)